ncbi:MAG: stage III sporulation protein AA [Lachnospiraceae bacterium]|nr:stage III sporulation protein AA [Lachnospiraceae bacterium]
MDGMQKSYRIKELFPDYMRYLCKEMDKNRGRLQEIRLRVNQPLLLRMENQEYFVGKEGELSRQNHNSYIMKIEDMKSMINYLCQYSLYAYESEIKQGYFTIQGGHRIGVSGQIVSLDGEIKNMKYISSMNIRIAHEIMGAADEVLPILYQDGTLCSTMIISSPGCGKTTLLRDLVRQISDGNPFDRGRTVGVVDERSEIGGSYMGIPQNHIGMRTDILDACPKIHGMMMLIRAMSPYVVAVDEIGSKEDMQALKEVLRCGAHLLVTAHGASLKEVQHKEWFHGIFQEALFKRFIVLESKDQVGKVEGIYDEKGTVLWKQ